MKTVRLVLAVLALSCLAPLQSAKAADVICYNCPPEWADWASMLKAVKADLGGDQHSPAAVAMIRPETIRVVDPAGAPLCGVIDSVSFIGDRQRMVVSGASDKLLTVDAPNTVLAKAGERVGLLIAPDAIRLLPAEN